MILKLSALHSQVSCGFLQCTPETSQQVVWSIVWYCVLFSQVRIRTIKRQPLLEVVRDSYICTNKELKEDDYILHGNWLSP